jgi:hypothetical protein
MRSLLLCTSLIATAAFAAEPPPVPANSIAKKKDLLFSDDFQSATPDKHWLRVVDTFTFEKGGLRGTQTRDKDIPAADGKPEVKAHAAVEGLDIPTKDSVVEVKIRFEGNMMMDVEFDDRAYTGSHYGHLCRAQVRLDKVTILDERDGTQSNALIELRKDAARNKDEINKILATHSISYPVQLEANKWYDLVVETVGDQMRVTIDGKPVAAFKSPGIAHPTKSRIEIGVAGKSGLFGPIKVYNADPAK